VVVHVHVVFDLRCHDVLIHALLAHQPRNFLVFVLQRQLQVDNLSLVISLLVLELLSHREHVVFEMLRNLPRERLI